MKRCDLLVNCGCFHAELASGEPHHQIALAIDLQIACAIHFQPQLGGIEAAIQPHVIFNSLRAVRFLIVCAAVNRQAQAIGVRGLYAVESRDVGSPLLGIVAEEIIGFTLRFICAVPLKRSSAFDLNSQRVRRGAAVICWLYANKNPSGRQSDVHAAGFGNKLRAIFGCIRRRFENGGRRKDDGREPLATVSVRHTCGLRGRLSEGWSSGDWFWSR